MFTHFLVSSDIHQEKNALSEAAWILSKYLDIVKFDPILLPVGGLSLLSLREDNSIPIVQKIFEHIDELNTISGIKYCYKITPLNEYNLYSEDLISNWVSSYVSHQIKEEIKWRITVNKRHNKVKTRNIINLVASLIKSGKVDLKNYNKIIQIEIIGNYVGLSFLEPFQILSLKKFIDQNKGEEDIGY